MTFYTCFCDNSEKFAATKIFNLVNKLIEPMHCNLTMLHITDKNNTGTITSCCAYIWDKIEHICKYIYGRSYFGAVAENFMLMEQYIFKPKMNRLNVIAESETLELYVKCYDKYFIYCFNCMIELHDRYPRNGHDIWHEREVTKD